MKIKPENLLMTGILSGIVLGGLCGFLFGESMQSAKFLGDFFLNALKMCIVPLIMCSVIAGVGNLGDIRRMGRKGLVTVIYYIATTGIAVLVGIILVNILQPGAGGTALTVSAQKVKEAGDLSVLDVILGMVSPQIGKSMAEMKILPLIVFSILLGGALASLGERGNEAIRFFDTLNDAIIKIIQAIMWIAPVGIFGLIAGRFAEVGGGDAFLMELMRLGKYAMTVILGLFVHGVIILPAILFLFTGIRPLSYAKGMAAALATAFSTASSSATLPVTMECAEMNNRVSKESASFVLPLGATINMDGTALYESVAAIFIAQIYGIDLSFAHQVAIFFTATLAAIGAAGIPEAGLVTMVIVLKSVGLPEEGIGLLLSIDWFLDRCRTTVNVWGDSVGAAVVDRGFRETP